MKIKAQIFFYLGFFVYIYRVIKTIKNMTLDYSKISDIEVDGIDMSDYPDFCDAYIVSASYEGRDMTDEELDLLNNDGQSVYDAVQNFLY
jgi:hypothetical protein